MLLTTKGPMTSSVPPKSKMKRPETKLYVKWVIQEITKHPEAFKEYTKGKGIIATREKYLKYLKTKEGREEMKDVEDVSAATTADKEKFRKTVIVPVAIPGCGTFFFFLILFLFLIKFPRENFDFVSLGSYLWVWSYSK